MNVILVLVKIVLISWKRVQQRGGQAAYVMVGANLATGHHDFPFDFDEDALVLGIVGSVTEELLKTK